MSSIVTGVMTPVVLHEQCQTLEVNEKATVHLPCAKFYMVVNQICNEQEEHQIAISFNGTYHFLPEMAVSNKTGSTITKLKLSMW